MKSNHLHLARREFLKLSACGLVSSCFGFSGTALQTPKKRSRISYYCNGEIQIYSPETGNVNVITSSHWDFKPSWSLTDDRLIFFRRLKNDPDVGKWITAICTIKIDGSNFNQITDGTYTDFNPTWSRDGKNTLLWNRKSKSGRYQIMASKEGSAPGEEVALTGADYSSWVHSALRDGRLLVSSTPPQRASGYYLMRPGTRPSFQRIQGDLLQKGSMDRVSISPSQEKICFEFQQGFEKKGMSGRTLYFADFDAERCLISNPIAFANKEMNPHWIAYPRWIDGEDAIVYHSGESGTNQLYIYRLADSSTTRIALNPKSDIRYPHGEASPC